MSQPLAALFATRSRWFDLGVFLTGLLLVSWATLTVVRDGISMSGVALISIPLIVVIAKFPMILDSGDGGIEVGFDSSILMYLLCTTDQAAEALVIWSLGVLVTQITTDKRPMVKLFNVGVGIVGGAVSAAVLQGIRGDAIGTPRELVAVAFAAAAYFATDFLLSAVSVAIESETPLRSHLVQGGTLIAVACFVPFDSLGYLGAVVSRELPWWTLLLLAVPLATLLVATRAVTRGSENARRLSVLFDAAVRAQTLSDTRQVVDALIDDARRLLRIRQVEVRATPPGPHEIGAQLRDGQRDRWIVAPGQHRARSTTTADQQALEAMVAVASDAFARLRLTEDMTHLARHDLLTDLPNRGLMLDRVEHALQISRRRGTRIALLFVDLDGFKPVNDRFGHAAGDAVLIDVAHRLSECVRQSDTVARLGGDEFALLLEDVHPPEVSSACERILAALSRGAHVAGHHLALSASVGVAFGDSSETAESMLRNADLAMYEAKSRGKNQWVEYERAIGRSRLQRLELVESLRASVAAGDLTLVYQPVVRASTGFITGVEALARWKSNGVDVPPDVFIRVAEETGLVVVARRRGARAGRPGLRRDPRGRRQRHQRQRQHLRQAAARARLRGQGGARDGHHGRHPAGPRDHRARRHRQRPRLDERDDDPGRPRRPLRDRRLRGGVLLDRLPAGHAGADHQDRPVVLREHRPRRAVLRAAVLDHHDGPGPRARRRGGGHRAGQPARPPA